MSDRTKHDVEIDYGKPPRSKESKHKSRHVAQFSNVPMFGRSKLMARIQQVAANGNPNNRLPQLTAFLQLSKWVGPYFKDLLHKKAWYRTYPAGETGVFAMEGAEVRLAVVSDWGTGTLESEVVAKNMMTAKPHFTLHLGDVYHLGDAQEIAENCLGKATNSYGGVTWPKGSQGSFSLMGNHEMYSGGQAYYRHLLPVMGLLDDEGNVTQAQRAGYFCLVGEHWIVLGLDTGYHSGGLVFAGMIPGVRSIAALNVDARFDDKMVAWLKKTMDAVQPKDGPKKTVIVLTHHQPTSAFEQYFTKPAKQIAELGFLRGQEFVWLYGHEHRLTVYEKQTVSESVVAYPRCIGHGGMPVSVSNLKGHDKRVIYYDPRVHAIDCEDPKTKVGYNGHLMLTMKGKKLTVEYHDIVGNRVLWTETFVPDGAGGLTQSGGELAVKGLRKG